MGADESLRPQLRRQVLTAVAGVATVAVLGAGLSGPSGIAAMEAVGTVGAQAPAPDSPFEGRLAKAVFLDEKVADALADVASVAPAASRTLLTEAVARARQPEPALATPPAADPIAASRLARRRALVQGMVALVGTPAARAEGIAASEALLPATSSAGDDAQGIGAALGLAELGESYLKGHRDSALTPYLYTYLMVQYRLAYERQVTAKAVEAQKASAKKYRTFRQRAFSSTEPLVKAAAEDVDAQLYLERPTPEHPRTFDPDACCRDK